MAPVLAVGRTGYFYPRSPCGERRSVICAPSSFSGFLSTLSLRRATERDGAVYNILHYFYPRSPCGERQGFYYRELGLYAEDPDPEVGEVLYCYGNCGDLAEWIPPSGGATIVEKTIDIVTAIGTATNVTAYIPADAYATKEDYETYKAIALGAQATAEEALALARQAIAIAQAAEASANDLSNAVGQNTSKIATLWDAVFSEITTNPFQITFADLTGITLTAGIWNSGLQRLEC